MPSSIALPFDRELLAFLRCPSTDAPLEVDEIGLVAAGQAHRYAVDGCGVPLFAERPASDDAKVQQAHYDEIATAYTANLGYPHTEEYMAYLNRKLNDVIGNRPLGMLAELCCGRGEAIQLLATKYDAAIGVDISQKMLDIGRVETSSRKVAFVQGDATHTPLAAESFDTVVMLGGIHHINDRPMLFAEVNRILKPGGQFLWREPVDDFWLWRTIRKLIYRLSPLLDHLTERPLRHDAMIPELQAAGLAPEKWHTCGFWGFCVFMNSDVLVVNRLFRFLPGIRFLTRLSARLDDMTTNLPGLRKKGLIVVGSAYKSKN